MKGSINSDTVVLDLGAGVGVLGFIAAQCGARRVYLVEPENVVSVAEEVARANAFDDRVRCLKGAIEQLEVPESVDVILSVFTGNFLLEEDLLPSLFYARDRYLKPGGVMLPARGRMRAVPVSATEIYERSISVWANYRDIDFSVARRYVANTLIYDSEALAKATFLAAPQTLTEMDFYTCEEPCCYAEVRFTVTESGLCHGWAGWFDMQLGDEWVTTNPHETHMHWNAVLLPLDPPIQLNVGDEVTFRLARPVYGEWSWWVEVGSVRQQHSTAFSSPYGRDALLKRTTQYQPTLGLRGRAWRDLLDKFDGVTTLEEMANFLLAAYPTLFRTREQAFQLIDSLVSRCT